MTKSVIETPLRFYQKMSRSKVLRKVIDVESVDYFLPVVFLAQS